ncbi:arginine--tRNA ligase [Candidatus Gottesmanbacteria bacterium RIFCSPLOWO2_01_FULL_43_11b]|uniref:Arginine--tRNA ligase n=1 Tax=Candidatus Gottesmanbacteria bacterium RIFCSPLOWO2_01_FULL_43_11b TaxID=1798392 RepID=A0A1F6AGP9_9BACT|nr:MAG: arginine--tRNA ligase [Candidatus Gottesmanbacteria bacterium RIFCSPLOWO2_01_FULL_43_11b]
MIEETMRQNLFELLKEILKEFGVTDIEPEVEISGDPNHGEYTTNIAMRVAKTLKKSPVDVALWVKKIIDEKMKDVRRKIPDQITNKQYQKASPQIPAKSVLQDIDRVEVVPPGFINFFLTESKLGNQIDEVLKEKERFGTAKTKTGKKLMVEFAHPNTHKQFHIGHLRNISTGESIVRLLESAGNKVIRVNYQGDVGLHIAKCIYGILKDKTFEEIKKKSLDEKIEYLGKAYANGHKDYEESAKREIGEINKKIYAKDSSIYPMYQETRKWSLDYFESIYKRVGTHYDRYYFEGEVYENGKKYVQEALKKGIFVQSDGAVVFPGEKWGLHNRVFITGEGNATYEAKDIGLGRLQFDEYSPDQIIHVVGPEQTGYFQVIFKALEQVFPDTKGKEHHLIYGWVGLKEGKMSSRSGNVVLGEWLLDEAKQSIYEILKQNESKYTKEEQDEIAEKGAVAAVKYAFLKVSTKQEIAFDLKESVSFDGDSGPYLLYTYARCKSVLHKAAEASNLKHQAPNKHKASNTKRLEHSNLEFVWSLEFGDWSFNAEERSIARLINFFPEIVGQAAREFAPNMLCTYLFNLAQAFNLFYQKHPILGNNARLALTAATAQTIQNGLYLLGISTVERM